MSNDLLNYRHINTTNRIKMKIRNLLFLLAICCVQYMYAQVQTDLEGALKIGGMSDAPAEAGTIRWNPATSDFEGFDGTSWVSLTGMAGQSNLAGTWGSALCLEDQYVITPEYDDAGITTSGGFGYDMAIGDSFLVVGAPFYQVGANDGQGAVFLLRPQLGQWTIFDTLVASDGFEYESFGHSVAIDGDYILVGAKDAGVYGRVYVFHHDNGSWTESQKLFPPSAFDGQFGYSVDIDSSLAIVSSYLAQIGGNTDQGKAYIYQLNAGFWSIQDDIIAPDGEADDQFGSQVAMDGLRVAISAAASENDTGSVYVFEPAGINWVQVHKIKGQQANLNFGTGLDLSGQRIIVGSIGQEMQIINISGSTPTVEFSGLGSYNVSIFDDLAFAYPNLLRYQTGGWEVAKKLYTSQQLIDDYNLFHLSSTLNSDWLVSSGNISFPFNGYEALFFYQKK
jgi:hypothetical protein